MNSLNEAEIHKRCDTLINRITKDLDEKRVIYENVDVVDKVILNENGKQNIQGKTLREMDNQ